MPYERPPRTEPDHPARKWKRAHRQAGYHKQEWDHANVRSDHPTIGRYVFDGGAFHVAYLERGHTGAPEYAISYENGPTLTVLDHHVVEDYVELHGARKEG